MECYGKSKKSVSKLYARARAQGRIRVIQSKEETPQYRLSIVNVLRRGRLHFSMDGALKKSPRSLVHLDIVRIHYENLDNTSRIPYFFIFMF